MERKNNSQGLTRGSLVKATGCPPYLVDYYRDCGYLPILRPSTGPGDAVLYHPDAVNVIRRRQARKRSLEAEQV